MTKFIINTDGAARGNPGPAGLGVVIKNDAGEIVAEIAKYFGEATNNQAEYAALLEALKKAVELKCSDVELRLDSELVVNQLKGIYKVKHEGLKPLFEEAKGLLRKFGTCNIKHVVREKNKEADKLANKAIDEHFNK